MQYIQITIMDQDLLTHYLGLEIIHSKKGDGVVIQVISNIVKLIKKEK